MGFPPVPTLEIEGYRIKIKDNGDGTFTLITTSSGGGSLSLQVNGTPNVIQTLLNLIAGSNITLSDNGAGGITIAAASAPVSSVFGRTGAVVAQKNDYLLVRGRQVSVVTDGVGSAPLSSGEPSSTTGTSTAGAPSATSGPQLAIFAGAVNTVAGISGNNSNHRVGRNLRMHIITGAAGKITDERWWIAFTDQSLATQGGSDNPVGNYAGFRFSTPAGDANWKCITKDGTTQTIVDSGVPPVINTPQRFGIIFNDSVPNVQFYINEVLVGTITTHLPTSGTNMIWVNTSECFVSTTSNGLLWEQTFLSEDF